MICRNFLPSILLVALTASLCIGQGQEGSESQDTPIIPDTNVEADPVDPMQALPDFSAGDIGNTDPFTPPNQFNAATLDLSDLISQTYPSLSDQSFSPLNGGLRVPRSILDDPRMETIVTQQILTERNPIDLGQALELEAGVMVQRTGRGQSSPFIRGLTGQQVLILVDGVRLSNATTRAGPNQYFNTVDPGMVERIEVIRGPGSVLYGSDAIGGVINIVTKSANSTFGNYLTGSTTQRFSTADLGYSGRVNVEGWVESMGVFAGGGYGNFNNVDRGGDAGRQPATSFMQYSGDIKFNIIHDDDEELVISLQHFEQQDVFRSDRFPSNRQTIFDPQQRDLAYLRYSGEGSGYWLDQFSITASFANTKEGRTETRPIGAATSDQFEFEDKQVGVTAFLSTDLGVYGRLNYGVDWYHEDINANRFEIDNTTGAGTPDSPPQFPPDSYYSRYGAYLEWDVELTECLRMVSGVRYEHDTAGGTITGLAGQVNPIVVDTEYQDFIGSVGLNYSVTEEFRLVASIGEGFRAPNLDDLTAINTNVFAGTQIPNPDIAPENSISYEVGAKYSDDTFRGQVFVYWTDLNDAILRELTGGADVTLQRTNRDAFVQGVDASGELLFDENWSTFGTFFYTYGKDLELNEPLDRIPPMQGTVGLRWRSDGGSDWFEIYTWLVDNQDRLSSRDMGDTNRIPVGGTPGYGTLNIRFGHMIAERHRVSINLENVTDRLYRVHGSGTDGPGFNAVLGYEWLPH